MTTKFSYTSLKSSGLSGVVDIPGDKSVSHRSLMFGALSIGQTTISGLLEGEDILSTAQVLRALGAKIQKNESGLYVVDGLGVGGLMEPGDILDMGNAGTGARLMMGILAAHPFTSVLTGDGSLRKRPMARVTNPLSEMGATFISRSGGRLPLTVCGRDNLAPITYELPVASAQVKSAILLAGLMTAGKTTVIEPKPTRDHTERMLQGFGANITVEEGENNSRIITLTGQPELTAQHVHVPADCSSAAFPVVAACIVPGSKLVLPAVGCNPLRFGLFETLEEMGANITIENQRLEAGEPVCDITACYGELKGIDVPPERAPAMIDEYPILAVAAACANGTTRMTGIGELRVKESDRIAAMEKGLADCGVKVETTPDSMTIHGTGTPPAGGAMVAVHLDHRIAMSFLVLGMATNQPVSVDDGTPVATSFPQFMPLLNRLGANISQTGNPL